MWNKVISNWNHVTVIDILLWIFAMFCTFRRCCYASSIHVRLQCESLMIRRVHVGFCIHPQSVIGGFCIAWFFHIFVWIFAMLCTLVYHLSTCYGICESSLFSLGRWSGRQAHVSSLGFFSNLADPVGSNRYPFFFRWEFTPPRAAACCASSWWRCNHAARSHVFINDLATTFTCRRVDRCL